MDTSAALVLKNFGGVPEITPSAQELKVQALALARPIAKVENEAEQAIAIDALQALKAIRTGMEATRKSVKAPVLELGRQIDSIASDFLDDCSKQEGRLQGLINHFQRKQLEAQRAEEERVRREQAEAQRLEDEAKRKREEAERANDPVLIKEAAKLQEKALDASMAGELSASSIVIAKPKGLVVKSRLNFQITDANVFNQAYPQFWTWHEEAETLKLKRREILEELNREDWKGIFHVTQYPEELPDRGSRLAKPPGMRIFEETKAHVR